MRKRTQAREYALQVLYQIDITKNDPKEIFQDLWKEHEATDELREFTERIVNGTIIRLQEIDTTITRHTENWELGRMAVVDRNVLRLGTFELLYTDDIPPKVAINEAVNLAKKFSQIESGKFVNGVLDKINHTEAKRTQSSNQ